MIALEHAWIRLADFFMRRGGTFRRNEGGAPGHHVKTDAPEETPVSGSNAGNDEAGRPLFLRYYVSQYGSKDRDS